MITVGLISLGCAKNLVDSEIMAGHLRQAGMEMTGDTAAADVVIVNTCSFLNSAKEESIQTILEAHEDRGMRKRRRDQKLIVAGCMAQRFSGELPGLLPEVDAFIGLDQVTSVATVIEGLYAGGEHHDKTREPVPNLVNARSTFIPDYNTPRFRLTPRHLAYVKIAEGCNHPCSFCIIPKIRGQHRSRTIESVVREARQLVAEGVREINLISQDTTYFGMDRWEKRPNPRSPVDSSRGDSLVMLLRELDAIEGDFWIRILYTHPAHWSAELIEAIAQSRKIARYVDMPLQHISDHMLGTMKRETTSQYIRNLVRDIRAGIPGIALRTTFITGFPGETSDDQRELLDFIRDTRFERLGVFEYSQEDGTRAALLDEQLSARLKKKRWREAMALQRDIAAAISASMVGRTLRVLVEAPGVARGEADAPDIDGRVYVSPDLPVGEFAEVQITGASGYDLLAGVEAPAGEGFRELAVAQ